MSLINDKNNESCTKNEYAACLELSAKEYYLRYNKFLKQSLSPSSVHGKINRWKNQVVWKKQPYQLSKRMKLKCTVGHVWIWRDLWIFVSCPFHAASLSAFLINKEPAKSPRPRAAMGPELRWHCVGPLLTQVVSSTSAENYQGTESQK